MRGASGLIEARYRHAVLRPAGHGPQRVVLRQVVRTAMDRAVDHVWVGGFVIVGAAHQGRQNLVPRQVGRGARYQLELAVELAQLNRLPIGFPLRQHPRLHG